MGQRIFTAAKSLFQSPFSPNLPDGSAELDGHTATPTLPHKSNINTRSKPRLSLSTKVGLEFPVSRVDRQLHLGSFKVSKKSSVFMSAVLQDLTETVLKEAGATVHRHRRRVIKPRDLAEVFKAVPELNELLKGCSIQIDEESCTV